MRRLIGGHWAHMQSCRKCLALAQIWNNFQLYFTGAYPGGFLRGFDLIILPYLLYVFGQTGLSKQCRPRSDATERGVWSGSTLFAIHPAIMHTFSGSKMDLLKRSTGENVPNLSNVSKIPHENEILVQSGVRLTPPNLSESAPVLPYWIKRC